jgi:hypothetical protein
MQLSTRSGSSYEVKLEQRVNNRAWINNTDNGRLWVGFRIKY